MVAGSGLAINFVIAHQMGSATLGVFNQIYAVYVVAAQIATLAVHDSAQKHVAQYAEDAGTAAQVSMAAVVLAAVSGGLLALGMFALSGLAGQVLGSPSTGAGLALAAPGLALFAINKVLLGVLNGQRRMGWYALGQSLRAFGIVGSCVYIALTGGESAWLGLSFTVAEAVLLPVLAVVTLPRGVRWAWSREIKQWMGQHFAFGTRAFVNGLLAEAYIRVDILMLGLFLSDAQVGVYSFAAMFIEGLFQVSVVVRTLANPVLVKLFAPLDKVALRGFTRRVAGLSFAMTAVAATTLIVVFPYLSLVFEEDLIQKGYAVLVVLAVGMSVYSVFVPIDHVLLQAGRPGAQSVMMTLNVLVNVGLNLTLIPIYGLVGAAWASAIAFAVAGVIINAMAWRYLNLKGGVFVAK